MKRLLLFFLIISIPVFPQTPTLVQSFWTEDSGANTGSFGSANTFTATYPEPTLAGNLLVCWMFTGGTGNSLTIADDQSETWTLNAAFPFNSASSNAYYMWYKANNVGSVRKITITVGSGLPPNLTLHCAEFYNVATTTPVDGTPGCHTVTSTTATGLATGTLTTGDLIFFISANDNANSSASFTAGSQSNITWILDAADRLDGYAGQYGVYNATATFTPQMTSGTSHPYTSCQIVFKSATAGTAPTQAMRIVHLGHYALPVGSTTLTMQVPSTGNLTVLSFTGGGDCIANTGSSGCATTAATTSIVSVPANTWNCTGSLIGSLALSATSQICYATNASTATTETIAVTRNLNGGGALTNDTILAYDITGANTSAFDNDAGASGNGASPLTTLTTTTAFAPGTSSGIVLANGNWNFGTATIATAPSGFKFDTAWTNMNNVNGPQPLDQNGGWLHLYNTNTSSFNVTWTLSTDGTSNTAGWAGRAAHFKAPSVAGPPGQFPRLQ